MSGDDACELPAFRTSDAEALALLRRHRTLAVVGMSRDEAKPSHYVPKYMQQHGYRVIPVNPYAGDTLLGEPVLPNLSSLDGPIDMVVIFRPPSEVPPLVDEAIAIGAKAVWMQEGIVNNAAADKARAAGLQVVMDKCMYKVHRAGGSP